MLFAESGDSASLIGEVIAERYQVLEKIGVGGMGVVYKARQKMLDRLVAVKVLPKNFAGDPEAEKRFFNEARAISQLRHPNVVTLFDFGRTKDGDLFIVMEYVAGHVLSALFKKGPIPVDEALNIAEQILGALDEAHRMGIVHRDVKPDNVMLESTRQTGGGHDHVRVLDFGIAKSDEDTQRLTKTGIVFGTPEYFSPEQAKGHETDGRSDIYSVGVILFEMLAGRRPYNGPGAAAIVYQHIHEPPPSLRREFPRRGFPQDVDELVRYLMAKVREQRPQTAEAARLLIHTVRVGHQSGFTGEAQVPVNQARPLSAPRSAPPGAIVAPSEPPPQVAPQTPSPRPTEPEPARARAPARRASRPKRPRRPSVIEEVRAKRPDPRAEPTSESEGERQGPDPRGGAPKGRDSQDREPVWPAGQSVDLPPSAPQIPRELPQTPLEAHPTPPMVPPPLPLKYKIYALLILAGVLAAVALLPFIFSDPDSKRRGRPTPAPGTRPMLPEKPQVAVDAPDPAEAFIGTRYLNPPTLSDEAKSGIKRDWRQPAPAKNDAVPLTARRVQAQKLEGELTRLAADDPIRPTALFGLAGLRWADANAMHADAVTKWELLANQSMATGTPPPEMPAPPDYTPAVPPLMELVNKHPKHERIADALYLIGVALYTGDRRAEAIEHWERLLHDFPEHSQVATVRLPVADFNLAARLPVLAKAHFAALSKAEDAKEKAYARCALGYVHYNLRELDAAEQGFTDCLSVLKEAPQLKVWEPEVLKGLMFVYAQQPGGERLARSFYTGRLGPAESPRWLERLALARVSMGRGAQAAPIFDSLIAKGGAKPDELRWIVGRAEATKAAAAVIEQLAKATRACAAVRAPEVQVRCRLSLGRALLEEGRSKEAKQLLTAVLVSPRGAVGGWTARVLGKAAVTLTGAHLKEMGALKIKKGDAAAQAKMMSELKQQLGQLNALFATATESGWPDLAAEAHCAKAAAYRSYVSLLTAAGAPTEGSPLAAEVARAEASTKASVAAAGGLAAKHDVSAECVPRGSAKKGAPRK